MTYDSIYDAVYDTYHGESMWDRMVRAGEPSLMNLAEEVLGRHADSPETGLRIRDFRSGATETYTFAELDDAANRAANYLATTMDRRERVGLLLEPRLELYACVFGGIKSHRQFVPLDTKFGPDAVSYRLADAEATTVVTASEHLDAVDPDAIPTLERVVVLGDIDRNVPGVEVVSYDEVRGEPPDYDAIRMEPIEFYAIGYSSGTTGQPSMSPSPHATCVAIEPYLKFVVDLQPEDVYFAAASPAWAYGLTVGTLCPGLRGTAIGAYRGPFDRERWVETLAEWGVTNAMVAPTALRQLAAGDLDLSAYDVDLRVLVTAGETLDESTARWCAEHLGTTPLDAYGLSEGGMVLCNYPFPDWEVKPGSMGKPLPGYEVALADVEATPDPEGDENLVDDVVAVEEPGETGEIAIRQTPYSGPLEGLGEEGWLLTGDLATVDEDGYWWYRGRADQVIISAGYRIGPEEVEMTLTDHDAVAEAGVVGVPDETRGNRVKAYVTLGDGIEPGDSLREDIVAYARSELSKHEYPRELEFLDELPKTASDKIHRRKLEERHGSGE